ncbi:uncharacterized protein LTR77_006344 [Saxophila tyrrhenica]|uniref:SHSP domain-containing protein n=1 Tax=Saxophila tyrrhenica TaxID=1690608 RepID=A0AAV9P899_9PEZI|nr:hypothetical protein LTR77_006344 [Saxophila tyrrhenica]
MSLFTFPRLVQNEFAGAFRLLDELSAVSRHTAYTQAPRTFAPRFSYRENKDNYELKGELPGVESKNVEIEFTDNSTLSIRGRTESQREEGERPAAESSKSVEAQPEQSKSADSETSSYHKASVEDESDATMSGANTEAAPTPAESVATTAGAPQEVAQAPKKEPGYFYSERLVGQFARTFNFPRGTVDSENVKASLKDGILSIVVPKLAAPGSKRISIE